MEFNFKQGLKGLTGFGNLEDPSLGTFGSFLRDIGVPEYGISERYFGGKTGSLEGNPQESPDLGDAASFGSAYLGGGTVEGDTYGPTQSFPTQSFDTQTGDGTTDSGGTDGGGGGGDGGGDGESSGYDKSATAESLGLTEQQFEAISKRYGFESTEDFFNSGIIQEIGNQYQSTLNYLDSARNRLKQDKNLALENVGQAIGENINTVNTQLETGQRQLGQQVGEAQGRAKDALTDAVRVFNELSRGGTQRFGGASSAGEAFQAIAGQQLQRNRQQTRNQFNQFVNQVNVAKQNLQQQYQTAVQNLESQKVRLQNEVRRDFQNKLLEIDRLRSEAESDKAYLRLEALQDLRNQQFQIQLATQERKQQVQQQASAQASQLDQVLQQQTQNNPSQVSNQAMGLNVGGLGDQTATLAGGGPMTGQIRPEDEERAMFGIRGRPRDEELNQNRNPLFNSQRFTPQGSGRAFV